MSIARLYCYKKYLNEIENYYGNISNKINNRLNELNKTLRKNPQLIFQEGGSVIEEARNKLTQIRGKSEKFKTFSDNLSESFPNIQTLADQIHKNILKDDEYAKFSQFVTTLKTKIDTYNDKTDSFQISSNETTFPLYVHTDIGDVSTPLYREIKEKYNTISTPNRQQPDTSENKKTIIRYIANIDDQIDKIKKAIEMVGKFKKEFENDIFRYNQNSEPEYVEDELISEEELADNPTTRLEFGILEHSDPDDLKAPIQEMIRNIDQNIFLENKTTHTKVNDIESIIYEPEFENIKEIGYGAQKVEIQPPAPLVGGPAKSIITETPNDQSIPNLSTEEYNAKDITTLLDIFNKKMNDYIDMHKQYNRSLKIYNKIVFNETIHTMYMLLILKNQLLNKGKVVYNYITKGTIEFFKRILVKIYRKIETSDSDISILYMKKYHFVTIMKLYSFFTWLSKSKKIDYKTNININKCTGEVYNRFLLFNFFKDTLESYNETFLNKITIYARINDIGNGVNGKRLFLSGVQEKLEKDGANYLVLDPTKCTALSTKSFTDKNKKYKFSEVFDTENLSENRDICNYMSLANQISKQKSVCLMTYGYSGTGKTYTLTGKSSKVVNGQKQDGIEGLLQSTLNQIKGLKYLKLRLFELYGKGVPLYDYWTDTKNLNKNASKIYHYILKKEGNNLNFDENEVVQIDGDKIGDFVRNTNKNTYITIEENDVQSVFKNFSDLTDKIEEYRLKQKRVRATPNNPVSSRSVLIYDFSMKVETSVEVKNTKKVEIADTDGEVTFLIIDLPGREDIAATFVDSYFDNQLIKKLLSDSIDQKFKNNERAQYMAEILKNPILYKYQMLSNFLNPYGTSLSTDTSIDTYDALINGEYKYIFYGNSSEEAIQLFNSHKNVDDALVTEKNIDNEEFKKKLRSGLDPMMQAVTGMINTDPQKYFTEFIGTHVNATVQKDDMIYHFCNNGLLLTSKFKFDSMIDLLKKHDILYEKGMYYVPENYTEDAKKRLMTDIANLIVYDYYDAGFEGVYINENIIGLLKYLYTKFVTGSNGNLIKIQDEKLRSEHQKKIGIVNQIVLSSTLFGTVPISNEQTQERNIDIDTAIQDALNRVFSEKNRALRDEASREINELQNQIKPLQEELQGLKDILADLKYENDNFQAQQRYENTQKGIIRDKINVLLEDTIYKSFGNAIGDSKSSYIVPYEIKGQKYNEKMITKYRNEYFKEIVDKKKAFIKLEKIEDGLKLREKAPIVYKNFADYYLTIKKPIYFLEKTTDDTGTHKYYISDEIGNYIMKDGKAVEIIEPAYYADQKYVLNKKGQHVLYTDEHGNMQYVKFQNPVYAYQRNAKVDDKILYIGGPTQDNESYFVVDKSENYIMSNYIDNFHYLDDRIVTSYIRKNNLQEDITSKETEISHKETVLLPLIKRFNKYLEILTPSQQQNINFEEIIKDPSALQYINKYVSTSAYITPQQLNALLEINNAQEYAGINIDGLYAKLKASYDPKRIFTNEKPLIQDILEPYLNKINDYKLFYLFANYGDQDKNQFKCGYQYELLNDTSDFIRALEPP
uniref:Kinesin motor domain-containing protein n=1 Tax=viral metagenome TaxID=1070528 RepID=A0A6C0EEW2_9ZZZZ